MKRIDLLLIGLGVLVGGSLPWCRVNLSPSVPMGLYRLHAVPATLDYGDLVLFPVPASVRPWHSAWFPLLKPVAGLPGDTTCINSNGYTINGADYGSVHTEADGKPLPRLRGCFLVVPGQVLTASSVPKSLDSRYFGPVPLAAVRAVATPLLTW